MPSLFRFEDRKSLEQNRVGNGLLSITFEFELKHGANVEYTVEMKVIFIKYKFSSANATKQIKLEEYHQLGGWHNSQFIGFFSNSTPYDVYHRFDTGRIPYFVNFAERVSIIDNEDKYDIPYSKDVKLFIANLLVARQIIEIRKQVSPMEYDIERVERKFVSNPVVGEHIVVANKIMPIVIVDQINIRKHGQTIRNESDDELRIRQMIYDIIYKNMLGSLDNGSKALQFKYLRFGNCLIKNVNLDKFDELFDGIRVPLCTREDIIRLIGYCHGQDIRKLKDYDSMLELLFFIYSCLTDSVQ